MTPEELNQAKESGFLDRHFKVYLNRYSYYEISKANMPEVIRFLDSKAHSFKLGEGGSRVSTTDQSLQLPTQAMSKEEFKEKLATFSIFRCG
jgi:hypothetical protein